MKLDDLIEVWGRLIGDDPTAIAIDGNFAKATLEHLERHQEVINFIIDTIEKKKTK